MWIDHRRRVSDAQLFSKWMQVKLVCGFEDGRRAFNTATSTTANSGIGLCGKQDSDSRSD